MAQTNMSIVPATGRDVPEIQEILFQTWLATYPNEEYQVTKEDIEYRFRNRHAPDIIRNNAERIDRSPGNSGYFVAKDGDTVIGVCYAHKRSGYNLLQVLYVLPAYHGTGVGYALWKRACEYFNPEHDTILTVATYNKHAIAFYRRLGFEATGRELKVPLFQMRNGAIIPEIEMLRPART